MLYKKKFDKILSVLQFNDRGHPLCVGNIGKKKTFFLYRNDACHNLACNLYKSCECDCGNPMCYAGYFKTLKSKKTNTIRKCSLRNKKEVIRQDKNLFKFKF